MGLLPPQPGKTPEGLVMGLETRPQQMKGMLCGFSFLSGTNWNVTQNAAFSPLLMDKKAKYDEHISPCFGG